MKDKKSIFDVLHELNVMACDGIMEWRRSRTMDYRCCARKIDIFAFELRNNVERSIIIAE